MLHLSKELQIKLQVIMKEINRAWKYRSQALFLFRLEDVEYMERSCYYVSNFKNTIC